MQPPPKKRVRFRITPEEAAEPQTSRQEPHLSNRDANAYNVEAQHGAGLLLAAHSSLSHKKKSHKKKWKFRVRRRDANLEKSAERAARVGILTTLGLTAG